MASKRLNGTFPFRRQNASGSRFLSRIKSKYRLPPVRAAIGQRWIISKRRTRSCHPLGLVYASMPTSRSLRFPRCINNLNIGLNVVLSWPANANPHIRDGVASISANGKSPLDKAFAPAMSRPGGAIYSMQVPGGSNQGMQTLSESNQGELAGFQEVSGRREFRDRSRSNEMRPEDQKISGFGSGIANHQIPSTISSTIPSGLELPPPRDSIGESEHYLESGLAYNNETGRSFPDIGRTSLSRVGRVGKTMQSIQNYVPDSVARKLRSPGFVSLATAGSIAPPGDMISIKDMPGLGFRSKSLDEAASLRPRSFQEIKSSPAASNPADAKLFESKSTSFSPIYRTVPARETIVPMELERPASISGRPPSPTESKVLTPSAQDLKRISDEVCSIIERKLLTERERRGIYG